jgi:hypothetical protein
LYWDPSQQPLAREALLAAGRGDLIGRHPRCLVPPGPVRARRARKGGRRLGPKRRKHRSRH